MRRWKKGGGVDEAERHDAPFEVCGALDRHRGGEGGGSTGRVLDEDLVVSLLQIYLGEDGGVREIMKEVIDVGEGIAVTVSDRVQSAVINAEAEGAVLFGDHEEAGGPRRGGGLNEAVLEEGCDL